MFSFPRHPLISVIIPTFGERGAALTASCVMTLWKHHGHLGDELEVVVVEDSQNEAVLESLDRSVHALFKEARIYSQPNGGFAKACNHGLHETNGQVVFLCNNDIEFVDSSLQYMSDAVMATRSGLMGALLVYPDMTIQHAGVTFVPLPAGSPTPGYFDHVLRNQPRLAPFATTMRPSLVTGALLAIPRPTIEVVGYLDESYEFTAEDIDYALKVIETGRDALYFGYTYAIHHEGATRGKTPEEKAKLAPDVAEKEERSLKLLFDKWNGVNWMNFATN